MQEQTEEESDEDDDEYDSEEEDSEGEESSDEEGEFEDSEGFNFQAGSEVCCLVCCVVDINYLSINVVDRLTTTLCMTVISR